MNNDLPKLIGRSFEEQIENFVYNIGCVWYAIDVLTPDGSFQGVFHLIDLKGDIEKQKEYVESLDNFKQWI